MAFLRYVILCKVHNGEIIIIIVIIIIIIRNTNVAVPYRRAGRIGRLGINTLRTGDADLRF